MHAYFIVVLEQIWLLQHYTPDSHTHPPPTVINHDFVILCLVTAIDAAFRDGLRLMNTNDGRPNIIIFLTDGIANVGESRESKILQNIQRWNTKNTTIYSLGFGRNVNYDFIRLVALQVCN